MFLLTKTKHQNTIFEQALQAPNILGQFHLTGMGSAIFDNYRKLSRKFEMKSTKLQIRASPKSQKKGIRFFFYFVIN